ncbi:hypothetical protein MITS9504_01954 [Synechococcus sp. MIT S9504]|nr:hypothetical protein MITS9504_01954 [Synechococcus sp. MIT S9504]
MHQQHWQVVTGGLKLLNPKQAGGRMADTHQCNIKLRNNGGLKGHSQRTNYGPTQNKWQWIAIIKKRNAGNNSTRQGCFSYHFGVTTCTKN